MNEPIAPTVIRGEVIDSDLIEYPGRGGVMTFKAPDPRKIVDRLPLASPGDMADLYDLRFDDILDYLEELGNRLDINTNEHMQRARELTYDASPVPPALVDLGYSGFNTFSRATRSGKLRKKASGSTTSRVGLSTS
jgi:hypothetical protein